MLLRPKFNSHNENGATTAKITTDSSILGSFYVWCKNCDDVKRGKLRVYCQKCSSTSVLVKSEPQNWSDVLKSKRIPAVCEECCTPGLFAEFKFKCLACNDPAAALTHVRGNWQMTECCVCDGKEKVIFDLGCNHITCQFCFRVSKNLNFLLKLFNFKGLFAKSTGTIRFCQSAAAWLHHFLPLSRVQ